MTIRSNKAEWIRRSDEIRENGLFGPGMASKLFVTPEIREKGAAFELSAIGAMIDWDQDWFDEDSDPDGLHEMAVFDLFGNKMFFKIEPLPGHPNERTLTIGFLREI